MKTMNTNHENFITVTHGLSGWFAVEFWWNPDMGGFWEPFITGHGRYKRKHNAIAEGEAWAEDHGLEFIMPE